jgi:hypothetical protein
VIQTLDTSHDLVKEGRFNAGDKIFWFKSGASSYLAKGNRITQDSMDYEINEVITHELAGTTILMEVRTKKT